MKKTSAIIKEKDAYTIIKLINNTALVKAASGKTGLLNVKINELIGDLDNFDNITSDKNQFFIQKKEEKNNTMNKTYDCCSSLKIYDTREEKIIADGWKIFNILPKHQDCYILKSPIDGKFHIFDSNVYRTDDSIFYHGVDNVELLYDDIIKTYLSVTINDKKGLYSLANGFITSIEFDEINRDNEIFIFTKNQKKFFTLIDRMDKPSIEFDEITFDKNNRNIIYCKKDNTIYVYNIYCGILLFKLDCDDVKFITRSGLITLNNRLEYFFIFKINDKMGLISIETFSENFRSHNTMVKEALYLGAQYDDIKYKNGIFYLKNNNKFGLLTEKYHKFIINPAYDKIDYLAHDFYAFYTNDNCEISKVTSELEDVITNCKIVNNYEQCIIFKKDNSYGIIFPRVKHSYTEEDVILNGYDNITYLGHNCFELEKDRKKGICYYDDVIIPLEYYNIKSHYYKESLFNNLVYFSLENENHGFELAKCIPSYGSNSNIEFVNNHIFEEIKFFDDIMVLKDKTCSLIYDYKENLLKTLPPDSEISMLVKNTNGFDKKVLYCIDGVYYFYKNEKFEKAFMEEFDLYVTAFESDYGIVVVNDKDKEMHDKVCNQIENIEPDKFDKILLSLYENNQNIQKDYPKLVKKIQ